MVNFVFELANTRVNGTHLPFYSDRVKGYTVDEIDQISQEYNLDIHGQFREFLLQMGKCSGGLLWSDSIRIYNNRNIQDFKNEQRYIVEYEEKQESQKVKGMLGAVDYKLFNFTHENEYCLFAYLVTKNPDDNVWIIDEGKPVATFEDTNITLIEYLKRIVHFETKQARFYEFTLTDEQVKRYTTGCLI